jgi:hypothetical protein
MPFLPNDRFITDLTARLQDPQREVKEDHLPPSHKTTALNTCSSSELSTWKKKAILTHRGFTVTIVGEGMKCV